MKSTRKSWLFWGRFPCDFKAVLMFLYSSLYFRTTIWSPLLSSSNISNYPVECNLSYSYLRLRWPCTYSLANWAHV
jgi:hypothetical protein